MGNKRERAPECSAAAGSAALVLAADFASVSTWSKHMRSSHAPVRGLPRMGNALSLAQWLQELVGISLSPGVAWGRVGRPVGPVPAGWARRCPPRLAREPLLAAPSGGQRCRKV